MTSVSLSQDESAIVTGSKDGSVIKWNVETGGKYFLRDRKSLGPRTVQKEEILSVAILDSNMYAAAGRSNEIHLYDVRAKEAEVHLFKGHKDAVTSLCCHGDALYSASLDRCIKKWDLKSMSYMETMFGHQGGILHMDCNDKILTSSLDRTIRLWNTTDESHSVYRGPSSSIECVSAITKEHFVSGDQNGTIQLWRNTQKRPLQSVPAAHGQCGAIPNWINCLSSLRNTDSLASGSCDGFIRLWKVDCDKKIIREMSIIATDGFVNSLVMTPRLIVAAIGKEHRMGRWWTNKGSQDRLLICRLHD